MQNCCLLIILSHCIILDFEAHYWFYLKVITIKLRIFMFVIYMPILDSHLDYMLDTTCRNKNRFHSSQLQIYSNRFAKLPTEIYNKSKRCNSFDDNLYLLSHCRELALTKRGAARSENPQLQNTFLATLSTHWLAIDGFACPALKRRTGKVLELFKLSNKHRSTWARGSMSLECAYLARLLVASESSLLKRPHKRENGIQSMTLTDEVDSSFNLNCFSNI